MGGNQKFKVVERSRRIETFQVTNNELNMIGSLTKIEQVVLNAIFAVGGVAAGTFISNYSAGTGNFISWVIFYTALSLTAVLVLVYISVARSLKEAKSDITN